MTKGGKIRVAYGAGLCHAPIHIALENGYFKDEGLDVEASQMDSAVIAEAAGSGHLDASYGLVGKLIPSIENGLAIKLTAGIHTGCIQVVTRKDSDIKTLRDLKKKKIGVASLTDSPAVIANRGLAAQKNGVSAANMEVEFETTEFESILSGLDTDRYQLGANNFSYNAERAKKYNFSLPITKNPYVLVVREDDQSIQSLDDLTGKKAVTEVGNSGATLLENYNKSHDKKIDIQYTDQDFIKQFQDIEDGKYDVRIISTISALQAIKEHGFKLKIIPFTDPSVYPDAYLLLPKTSDGDQLLKVVNAQIKKIYQNGTLEKISKEQLGASYLPDKADIDK